MEGVIKSSNSQNIIMSLNEINHSQTLWCYINTLHIFYKNNHILLASIKFYPSVIKSYNFNKKIMIIIFFKKSEGLILLVIKYQAINLNLDY